MNFYKHILILILLLTACEEIPDFSQNPFEAPEDEQIPEIVFLDEFITGNTATLNWSGNSFALGFSYKLEIMDEDAESFQDVLYWTDWNTDSSVTLEYLDDGNYRFNVRTHFNFEKEDEESLEFAVNDIPGNSIRIFPLMQYIDSENSITFELYFEEVENVSGIEIELGFDPNHIEFNGSDWGGIISKIDNSGNISLFPNPDYDNDKILVTAAIGGAGFSGTGPLLELFFNIAGDNSGWVESSLNINNANMVDKNGDNIPIDQLVSGNIRIQ